MPDNSSRKKLPGDSLISSLLHPPACEENKVCQEKRRVFRDLDLSATGLAWDTIDVLDVVFLGCLFPDVETESMLRRRGALIFPEISCLPFDPFRSSLYTWEELMEGYDWDNLQDKSLDRRIYDHVLLTGNGDIVEALARRIHDNAIDEALDSLLAGHPRVAGIMGGHSMLRTGDFYGKIASLAQELTSEGYFVVTGGGPGAMEAGNLGAWLGGYPPDALEEVLAILREAPDPGTWEYQAKAREVLSQFPEGSANLAIPTWFYPHEPTNLFASHIAKYFSNSIREDGLLAICIHGVVYCPGSAGTTQEIFMDATQNHYGSFGFYSPMVFMGSKRYTEETAIYQLMRSLSADRTYGKLLFLSDDPREIVAFLNAHPPIPVESN